nr:hypothetical protein [Moorella glycerini]
MEAEKETILKYLSRRFGEQPADLEEKVQKIGGFQILDSILEELFTADTIEEANYFWKDRQGPRVGALGSEQSALCAPGRPPQRIYSGVDSLLLRSSRNKSIKGDLDKGIMV